MEKKLITIDLDGTTLNKQGVISPKTKYVLQKASQQGHIVSIVTGRPYRISKNIYDQLGINSPMINFNGALGHIPHQKWDKEYELTFDKKIALDLLNNKKELGIKIIAAEGKNMSLTDVFNQKIDDFFPVASKTNEVLNKLNLRQDPAAITMLVEKTELPNIVTALNQGYGQQINVGVWGGPNPILELSPKNVNKAHGVKYLANAFNIDRKNIIAFGDEHNDVEMIDYAGWGVVMQNGTKQLKAIANDITPLDNDHDGLAHYLEDYLELAE